MPAESKKLDGAQPTEKKGPQAPAPQPPAPQRGITTSLNPLESYVKERGGKHVVRKVLIANNGMAAAKAINSMRRWTFIEFGSEQVLTFIAMATQDDLNANAEFIRLADKYVEVPSGKNINNYANVDLICKIAKENNVDAVWPGWGHASENPKLPDTLKEMGIVFIGPTGAVMSALGDKIAANILAQTANVPSIPWSGDGLKSELTKDGRVPEDVFNKAMVHSVEEAVSCAEKIGYPVMVKASEGGGGKGIRKANNADELRVAYTNVEAEVVGSPIFMMQMCTQARHLEVQILGDEYGNTVALNGRDCSTQRRFQKIFEEGPPVVANPSTFKEMERAAMRLTAHVGYRGAGTVEYLYSVAKDAFYFLELNPRLQVEHPVTESITGCNLPSVQLQIAMGIPLYCIPDIRRFYGMDTRDTGKIDFFKTDYPPINTHCLASRITAENPDEGFKPTSGKIDSIKFQSSGDCWGYFSVGLKGGIHEFADSQFGHVFAKGPNRNEARKSLLFALKNIEIAGDIRHPVDYLCELLELQEFKENTIDTMWLDKLIAGKLVAPHHSTMGVVFYAAVYRAHELVKKRMQEILTSVQKGQLVLLGKGDTDALISFPLEIVFAGLKYSFKVSRSRADTYVLTIEATSITAKVREQPDGALYVSVGSANQIIKGMEEALGLRMMIGAQTVVLPTVYDPSELRSDVNGKVVRYLHDEGAEIAKGEPYVELEAMKMIMALKSGEAGKISHTKSAGSIVSAGELLATLELQDPSMVQKIVPFEGEFSLGRSEASTPRPFHRQVSGGGGGAVTADPEDELSALLDGYDIGVRGALLVENMFETFKTSDAAAQSVRGLLEKYLTIERPFAASLSARQPYDKLLRELITVGKEALEKVVMMIVAHNKLADRNDVIMACLRQMVAAEGSGTSCMHVPEMKIDESMDVAVYAQIQEIAQMPTSGGPTGDYGNVRYLAKQLLDVVPHESIEDRLQTFRKTVDGLEEKSLDDGSFQIGAHADGGLDVEMMVWLLNDKDAKIQERAMRVYLRWLCMPSRLLQLQVMSHGETCIARWTQQFPTAKAELHDRSGLLLLVQDLGRLVDAINAKALSPMIDSGVAGPLVADSGEASAVPLNILHVVLGSDAFPTMKDRTLFFNTDDEMERIKRQCIDIFSQKADLLRVAGIGEICVALPQPPRHPRFLMFVISPETEEWSEFRLGRDMWSSFVNLLELRRLKKAYTLQRIHKEVRPTSHIYLAARLSAGGQKEPPPEVLMRGLYYSSLTPQNFGACLAQSLELAMQEVEHAVLDPRISKFGPGVTSRIFMHFLCELDMQPEKVMATFQDILNTHMGKYGAEMMKLCTDEIEVKVRSKADGHVETLRLSSSSLGGGYMKMKMLHEIPDPITGNALRWERSATEGAGEAPTDQRLLAQLQAKRVAARRAGSIYAYDLAGLFKVALSVKWTSPTDSAVVPMSINASDTPSKRLASNSMVGGTAKMPNDSIHSTELVMNWKTQDLEETERPVGSNDVGMIAWRITLKTPEYPEGRDIILIANDVTFQAGSFGVREDIFFQKASEFARVRGLPRIYISCNSGARVGLVEELKPLYKVKWIDGADPGKGFEYLYLSKADYQALPPNTVQAHPINDGGEERYVIDAIIGESQKSTQGGIGVENLQGSGLIAGETSRAYQETFTLSYITGRSVGIGAYLNRLGQRTIQNVTSPMILTGYSALNKLLGKNVYVSQDQLGGPQIMVPNGVTHQVVRDDQEGISAILDWLSFVPKDAYSLPPMSPLESDPWDREVELMPTKQPYDPRGFLKGAGGCRGFFDSGSFIEYLEGWGRTVVVGRARLGGIPMGVIAVETRSVERFIPADPANADSAEVVEPQAGQVWFPDSAFKTAQALRDFNRAENLPVMIFANWRGFSGGTRDMYGEILKYGAQIVDALVDYKHPIFIYIPPYGELRGGAWVVIDPAINPDRMEMYADVDSRGGILEPPGIVEVKYRAAQQVEAMHRQDAKLIQLDGLVAKAEGSDKKRLEAEVKAREGQLMPLYTSVAVMFADLHDRTGRMKAKGVIRDAVEWKQSRRYFFWRVRRRMLQDFYITKLQAADTTLAYPAAASLVKQWALESQIDLNDDTKMVGWLESLDIAEKVAECRANHLKKQIQAMFAELPDAAKKEVLGTVSGKACMGSSASTEIAPAVATTSTADNNRVVVASPSFGLWGLFVHVLSFVGLRIRRMS